MSQETKVLVTPVPPGAPLLSTDVNKAIELLQAQIAGVKQEITQLTAQLTPQSSHALEEAISAQLAGANERLQQLQGQLDRAISGSDAFTEVPVFPDPDPTIPREVMQIIEMALVAACVIALGTPLIRMIARRLEPKPAAGPSDAAQRFDRLEQAVDAVAIEVERISEGQRYSSRMLSELRGLPAPNPLEQWPALRAPVKEEQPR
jgi:hypothetical protein